MMDGIDDALKVVKSMVFRDHIMPEFDEEGKLIQSEEQAGEYVRRFKKYVEEGKILRYSWHRQISSLDCYKGLDNCINQMREKEAIRLNEKYYGREKYIKIKQCM